ncbi:MULTISPECIES: energy transducer TonB [Pseudoalteromonas]|uniref:Protein TonB n=1 Tax=Pseudoalteromonas obscura TaxID=3048491 RepID=A0ABT7EN20_9GAMM|nr:MULTISPECIES: energy transducer TonB [Pseudoalteromonas]MDK2596446.1 energy transducer TonB [Pseudoalteromonas sp. P94(2023)]
MTLTMTDVKTHTPYRTLNKLVLSFISAILITFALFAFMQKLISQDRVFVAEPAPVIDVFISQDIEDTPVEIRNVLPPPPKATPKAPPKPTVTPSVTEGVTLDINITSGVKSAPIQMQSTLQVSDAAAAPIVRIDPTYPAPAARDGVEGWVQLAFNISPTGQVIDAKVVNAEPKRVFNRAALKALKRWKYRPKMVAGKPTIQYGQSVVLEFNLNK